MNPVVVFLNLDPVADLRGGAGDAPPPGVQILSISCSFWEILAKSYVSAPPLGSWHPLLGEILDPPLRSIKNFFLTISFVQLKSPSIINYFRENFMKAIYNSKLSPMD